MLDNLDLMPETYSTLSNYDVINTKLFLKIFKKAIDKLRPKIDFVMVKTSTTEKTPVPRPIQERRALRFATRWIHEAAMQNSTSRQFCTTSKFVHLLGRIENPASNCCLPCTG